MKSAARYSALVGVCALGLLAALLTFHPAKAHAYTMEQLANMGFGVVFISLPENGCHAWKIGWHNDPKTYLGSDCDPGFQDKLDAFLKANCPPSVCGVPTYTVTNLLTETTSVLTTVPGPTVTDLETATVTSTDVETVTTADTETETDTLLLPSLPAEPVTVTQPVTVIQPVAPMTTTVVQPHVPHSAPAPVTTVVIAPPPPPDPPHASFTAATAGLAVSLTDSSGAGSVTWSFGDGTNGTGVAVTHLFPRAGSYTVVETVIDWHGLAAQSARTVTVTPPARTPGRMMPTG